MTKVHVSLFYTQSAVKRVRQCAHLMEGSMSRSIPALALASVLMCGGVSAAAAATPHHADMTCKDFLSIDEVTRPKVVYWAEGLSHKGKPEDAVVDVDATNRLVPVIVEQCKAAPQASFWQKMDAEWHRFEADVKNHL